VSLQSGCQGDCDQLGSHLTASDRGIVGKIVRCEVSTTRGDGTRRRVWISETNNTTARVDVLVWVRWNSGAEVEADGITPLKARVDKFTGTDGFVVVGGPVAGPDRPED
jgi:hypothetical protein